MLRVLSRWPGMPRKPEQLKSWTIYKVAAKAILLGTVEAPDKRRLSKQRRTNLRQTLGVCTRCRGDDAEREAPPYCRHANSAPLASSSLLR
jgi:hypothetical protein